MEFLAAIFWDVSPVIFKIGPVAVRWYGLMFAVAFIAGYQVLYWIFKTEGVPVGKPQNYLESLMIIMILGTVLGARLGHCLFYDPVYYLSNPFEMLKIWEGGLASHGAIFGNLLGLWLFTRKKKEMSFLWLLDRMVIVVALGGVFIRLGNFFNSEIIGKAADIPWAVIFARVDMIPRHPGQLYESIAYLLIFLFLLFQYKRFKEKLPQGLIFGWFMFLIFSARFYIEFFKENQSGFEEGMILNMGQFLSVPFIFIGIFFIIRAKRFWKK